MSDSSVSQEMLINALGETTNALVIVQVQNKHLEERIAKLEADVAKLMGAHPKIAGLIPSDEEVEEINRRLSANKNIRRRLNELE